jgi:regulatory factor X
VAEEFQPYIHPQAGQGQHVFHSNPEEMIIRFGEQLSNSNSGTALDPTLQNHSSVGPRADVHFQSHELHSHGVPIHGLSHELTPHCLPGDVHPIQYSSMYDGIENQMPDHVIEDNEVSETGHRKRRGTMSTIANDNELRRLLRQYDGYSLQQMAAEVQKHEGAGGKSEKVKQVFAMIW